MANLSVEEPDALMCARPGLWEPWRATARATRPEALNGSGSSIRCTGYSGTHSGETPLEH